MNNKKKKQTNNHSIETETSFFQEEKLSLLNTRDIVYDVRIG